MTSLLKRMTGQEKKKQYSSSSSTSKMQANNHQRTKRSNNQNNTHQTRTEQRQHHVSKGEGGSKNASHKNKSTTCMSQNKKQTTKLQNNPNTKKVSSSSNELKVPVNKSVPSKKNRNRIQRNEINNRNDKATNSKYQKTNHPKSSLTNKQKSNGSSQSLPKPVPRIAYNTGHSNANITGKEKQRRTMKQIDTDMTAGERVKTADLLGLDSPRMKKLIELASAKSYNRKIQQNIKIKGDKDKKVNKNLDKRRDNSRLSLNFFKRKNDIGSEKLKNITNQAKSIPTFC